MWVTGARLSALDDMAHVLMGRGLTCCEHMALSQLPHEGRLRHNASHERSLFARASRCSYNHACKKGKEKNKYKKKKFEKKKMKKKSFSTDPG